MAASGSTVIPCLRYRNAPRAIDWRCNAFGFERHAVYADGDTVHRARPTYGGGMVDGADAHHAAAQSAGPQIVIAIAAQDYRGRGYACRDLEGHLWWFGSHDPWTA